MTPYLFFSVLGVAATPNAIFVVDVSTDMLMRIEPSRGFLSKSARDRRRWC
jgi:hypothetical protein